MLLILIILVIYFIFFRLRCYCPNNYNISDFLMNTLAIVPGEETMGQEKIAVSSVTYYVFSVALYKQMYSLA